MKNVVPEIKGPHLECSSTAIEVGIVCVLAQSTHSWSTNNGNEKCCVPEIETYFVTVDNKNDGTVFLL